MATSDYSHYLRNIPVAPHIAAKVLTLAEQKNFSYGDLERLVSVDPGLTAKILRIANSSQFARPHEVKNLRTAMNLVGINTLKNLVLLVTGSTLMPRRRAAQFYDLFWSHSILSAFGAKELAVAGGFKELAEQAFVAGLLHNLGQMALYLAEPKAYQGLIAQALVQGTPIGVLEDTLWGTNHRDVGYQVLDRWNFPPVYSQTAREHGQTNITSEFKQTIILVSVASFVASNRGPRHKNLPLDLLTPYLPFLGLDLTALQGFQDNFLERIAQDPLFAECQEIFSLPVPKP